MQPTSPYSIYQNGRGDVRRDPPPYPGFNRGFQQTAGYRQSYASSETGSTDMSLSSCENLSTSMRQDPQGEETRHPGILSSPIDMTHAAYPHNTYVQESPTAVEIKSANSSTFYVTGNLPSQGEDLNLYSNTQQLSYQQPQYNNSQYYTSSNQTMSRQQSLSYAHPPQHYSMASMSQKDDPYKKWRHVYVNQKPQQQQFKSFQQETSNIGSSTNQKYDSGNETEGSFNLIKGHPLQHPYVNEMTSIASEPNNDGPFTSGSMIAKLKQEFCQSNPSAQRTEDNKKEISNVRATYDRVRSATPDFLSNHQSVAKQLPMRPSSANSKQQSQDRQLSFAKKHDKITKQKSEDPSCSETESPIKKELVKLKSSPGIVETARHQIEQQMAARPPAYQRSNQLSNHSSQHSNNTNPNSNQSSDTLLSVDNEQILDKSHTVKQTQQTVESPENRVRSNELNHAAIATRATQMVERLSDENRSLRQELEGCYSKVSRLQKVEVEIQRVTDAYEALVKQSSKKESTEQLLRFRLETEVKKLRDQNRDLKDHLEKALVKDNSLYYSACDAETKRDLKEKDTLIAKIIDQNRDLNKARNRLEDEVSSLKDRCDNYTNHIEILEATLKTLQRDNLRLQDQICRNESSVEKIDKLQSALSQFRVSAEKRETIELKLRTKLEDEIRSLKQNKLQLVAKASDTDEGISSDYEGPSSCQRQLRDQLQQRDQQILKLEAQLASYEQRFIEEVTMRQLAVDAASVPKDAKIAALEQNSYDSERLISEANSEKMRHLEELYKSSKKAAELEARVKTLTAQLAEKEAMLNVLRKQSMSLSRTSSLSSLFSSSSRPVSSSSRPSSALSPTLQQRDAPKLSIHSKSNSDGGVLEGQDSPTTTPSSSNTPTNKLKTTSLKQVLAQQAQLFRSWQTDQPDDIMQECWQV